MANCLFLHDSYITKFDFINYAFDKLAWNLHDSTYRIECVYFMNCTPTHFYLASVQAPSKGRHRLESSADLDYLASQKPDINNNITRK